MTSLEVIWDHLRRHYPDKHEITVDALVDSLKEEKHLMERHEVVALFQEWERQKLGSFTVGRRRQKSRIWLNGTPRQQPTVVGVSDSKPVAGPSRKYELPLSEVRSVTLEFPSDLSGSEVERIATFLRFYVTGTEPQISVIA